MHVTICLPFFNDRKTIGDAVRSIFAQTYTQWNLILMDDGSQDGCLEYVKKIRDPRVRVFSDGLNKKVSPRLNEMHQLADGKYIFRMDADDISHPERVKKQVEFLEANPDVDVLGTGGYMMTANNVVTGLLGCEPLDNSVHPFQIPFVNATNATKAAWHKHYLYNNLYIRAEDQEIWTRALAERQTTFAKLNEPLYFVRKIGLGSLPKTILSYRTLRRIAREYGPELIGNYRTNLGITKLYAKEGIHRLAHFVGMREKLWHNSLKGITLTVDEKIKSQEIIQTVQETYVPGWELTINKQLSAAA